jgi:hypothetical protein
MKGVVKTGGEGIFPRSGYYGIVKDVKDMLSATIFVDSSKANR